MNICDLKKGIILGHENISPAIEHFSRLPTLLEQFSTTTNNQES